MTDNYTPDINKLVAERIDKLRVDNSYSIRELAKKSFISHNSLFSIIRGTKSPNIYTLSNICKALNICSGVPSNKPPMQRLNKVSPVKRILFFGK